jgi:hypothetical protein
MKLITMISFVFLLITTETSFSQKHTIYGFVKDSISGEILSGSSIFIKDFNYFTISNNYGFFSITVPDGEYNLSCSYVGYFPCIRRLNINKDERIEISLSPQNFSITEVIISANKEIINKNNTSTNKLDIGRIKSIPSATGEPDVLKSLQLLPGIQTSNEGSASLNIRGGSYDQNLILLDEAPVYNASHSLGFFSAFNPDAISSVTVYKGAYPAKYGGKLSSVVDISMKEGNNKKFVVMGGAGLMAGKLSFEGPIIRNKASFIISARYAYAGQTLNLLAGKIGRELLNLYALRDFASNNKINFNDFNLKFNYQINPKNHLYLSSYSGRDIFLCYPLEVENYLDWGNRTFTLRWNHIFGPRVFSNYTIYSSDYNYTYQIDNDIRNYNWKSEIKESGIKSDFNTHLNKAINLKYGAFFLLHTIYPGKLEKRDAGSIIKSFSLDRNQAFEPGFYVSNEQQISERISIIYDFRYSAFVQLGEGIIYKYNESNGNVIDSTSYKKNEIINSFDGIEPRLSLNYRLNDKNSAKIAYAHSSQYLHLLSNSSLGLPTDTWLPSGYYVKPEKSKQIVIGYYYLTNKSDWEISVEGYYRTIDNIIDLKDNADLFLNKHIVTQVLQGKGFSKGIECLVEKKAGKFNGWLSYTLANTKYKIPGINNNKTFSPRFDIRHNLSFTWVYKLNKCWSLSSTFKLTSGGYITVPQGVFIYNESSFYFYSSRNGYKLPTYHRLDASFSYKSPKNEGRKLKSEWVFGVYNIYNHKNVYSLFVRQEGADLTVSNAFNMYLFGMIPSFSYNFKF